MDKRLQDITLSPSGINNFYGCKRRFFYTYHDKIRSELTAPLVKGNIVHGVIEKFSKNKFRFGKTYKTVINKFVKDNVDIEVKKHDSLLTQVDKDDVLNMVKSFTDKFIIRMSNLVEAEIAHGPTHAFHLLKPKLAEHKVSDDILNVRGIIDNVDTNIFSGRTCIIDYKTSKKYGYTMSEDYKRQLAIYAYLCKVNGIDAHDVAINFLRYGEIYYLPVTIDLIKYGVNEIETVRQFLVNSNEDKNKFYRSKTKLCDYCPAKDKCFKEEVEENEFRIITNGIKKNRNKSQTCSWTSPLSAIFKASRIKKTD